LRSREQGRTTTGQAASGGIAHHAVVRKPINPRGAAVTTPSFDTESVVRDHLHAFVARKGVDAILEHYDDDARFYSEENVYRGKDAIRGFFTGFIASLPPDAVDGFSLRSLRVDGPLAFITWSAGRNVPLGTDTFVVKDGKIVSQTFAMYFAFRS
jgi:hypothetical protein